MGTPATPALSGRREELTTIDRALAAVGDGGGCCLVLMGEAGIGKTAILEVAATKAEEYGYTLWRSKADEVASARPLDPLLRLGVVDPSSIDGDKRQVGGSGAVGFADTFVAAAQRAAATRPLIVILDDLHWADAETARALPLIVRDLADHPVIVVVALRPWPHSADVAAMVRRLDAAEPTVVKLGPLAEAEVVEMAQLTLGQTPDGELVAALAAAGGNPFLATAITRLWLGRATAGEERPVLERMIESLPSETVELLSFAAVFGGRFRLEAVAELARTSVEKLWPSAKPAEVAGLISPVGDAFRFQHDLIREAIYQSLPAGVRSDRHRRASAILLRQGVPPSDVLRHLIAALSGGLTETVPLLIETAEQLRIEAPGAAADVLRRVRDARGVSDEDLARVDEILAECCVFSGNLAEAEAVARNLLAHGPVEPTRSRLEFTLASTLFLSGQLTEAAERFNDLYHNGDPRGVDRGVAGTDAALAQLTASDLASATVCCDEVLAADSGAVATVYASGVRSFLHALEGDLDTGLRLAERGVAMADANRGSEADRNTPHYFLAQVQVWADRHQNARETIAVGRDRSAALGLGWHEPMFHVAWAESFLRSGDADTAAALAEAGLRYAADHGAHIEDARLHSMIAEAALLEDDLTLARAHLSLCNRRQKENGGHGADRLFLIQSHLARRNGDLDVGLATLEMLWGGLDVLEARLPQWDIAPSYAFLLRAAGRTEDLSQVLKVMGRWRHQPRPWVLDWCQALLDSDPDTLTRLWQSRQQAVGGGGLDAIYLRADVEALGGSIDEPVVGGDGQEWWREQLTPTENQVVEHLASGRTNAEIADALFVSRRTVESHLYRVYPKLQVVNRVELALLVSESREVK